MRCNLGLEVERLRMEVEIMEEQMGGREVEIKTKSSQIFHL